MFRAFSPVFVLLIAASAQAVTAPSSAARTDVALKPGHEPAAATSNDIQLSAIFRRYRSNYVRKVPHYMLPKTDPRRFNGPRDYYQ